MRNRIIFLTSVCSLLIFSISLGGKMHEKTVATMSIKDVSESTWKTFSEKKIVLLVILL